MCHVALRLSPRHVVVQHDLRVLRRDDVEPRAVVPGTRLRVDVYDFPIALVLKQQTAFVVRDDLEVRRRVRRRRLRLPVEERQVRRFREEPPLTIEHWL